VSGRLASLLLALLVAGPAAAHELRPGYLALRELGGDRWQAHFRVPARDGRALALRAVLPDECREQGTRAVSSALGARDVHWSVACPRGLAGREIRVEGLAATLTDVLVRIERADGTVQTARLLPRTPALRVEAAPAAFDVAHTYLAFGVEHILLGLDHLLFVLALLWVVRGRRRLVATITAFTLAHSVTLALATLGLLRVPQAPVEASIALSIAFVAREISSARERESDGTRRVWLVAFVFGLLHGLGFAGALHEIGLPEQAIPLALLSFNLGVELGQLAFVGVALALAAIARGALPRVRWPDALPAYGIGALAACWTIERVLGFWS
jgi:hydrogenase/urease accessory protein HupE